MQKIFDELRQIYTSKKGTLCFSLRLSEDKRKKVAELLSEQDVFDNVSELLWAMSNNVTVRPTCIVCAGKVTLKNGIKDGFYRTCSVKCAASDPERNLKIKSTELVRYGGHHTQTASWKEEMHERFQVWPGSFGTEANRKAVQEKYGVTNVFQSTEIKEKIKATLLERYGVDNPLKSEKIKSRVKNTNVERYGAESPLSALEVKEKIKATLLERYGVDNPLKSDEIKDKIKRTCQNRYGVDHVMQYSEILDKCMRNQLKSRYKGKTMYLPSGKEVKYQGYENFVINYLLQSGVEESDLELERTNIPTITYSFENKDRRYYPNMYVKSKNMLIEVKSTYTFDREIEKNLAKQRAAKNAGFHHIIIVWDVKENRILEVY